MGEDQRRDVAAARGRAAEFELMPPRRPAGPLARFGQRYGWRAYALPVLVVVTIVAVVTMSGGGQKHPAGHPAAAPTGVAHGPAPSSTPAPPTASGNIALKSDTPSAGSADTALQAAALPSGGAYTLTGAGTFRVLPGTSKVYGTGTVHRFDIEVENGITGIDLNQFETLVQSTLFDPRSWVGHNGVALQRVDSGPVDWHITLTSSMTVRTFCGYSIPAETSCYAAAGAAPGLDVNRVVINDSRWVRGDAAYIGDLTAYREYMINHEDGHALGHEHAHECLADGLAPTMMQQTFGLRSAATGKFCQANPWPYPPGAKDAPGAEQPDTAQNDEYGKGD